MQSCTPPSHLRALAWLSMSPTLALSLSLSLSVPSLLHHLFSVSPSWLHKQGRVIFWLRSQQQSFHLYFSPLKNVEKQLTATSPSSTEPKCPPQVLIWTPPVSYPYLIIFHFFCWVCRHQDVLMKTSATCNWEIEFFFFNKIWCIKVFDWF